MLGPEVPRARLGLHHLPFALCEPVLFPFKSMPRPIRVKSVRAVAGGFLIRSGGGALLLRRRS